MSHVSNISTEGLEFDLDVVKTLCQRQGWEFLNQNTFVWYGRFMGDSPVPENFTPEDYGKCDYAIRVPGCHYELGIVKSRRPGSQKYNILGDFWYEGGLDKVLGKQGERFRSLYLQTEDIQWAEAKNFNWEELPGSVENSRKLVVYVDDFGGGDW
jgi:hypothetical protein